MSGFSYRVDVGKGEERDGDAKVLGLSWPLWLDLFARVSISGLLASKTF